MPSDNNQNQQSNHPASHSEVILKGKKKYYTFNFKRYESQRMQKHKRLWWRRTKIKFYIFGFATAFFLVVGNIYPIMMWFEYDINMYRPRVSNYILNRLG